MHYSEIAAAYDRLERQTSVMLLSYVPEASDSAGIVSEICEYRGVTLRELRGPSRSTKYARARQEIAYWLRQRTDLSFTQIGRKMGRDHTWAIYSCRVYTERFGMPIEWQGVNTHCAKAS